MKKFYITTPIYYPSGKLHIGHVYTTTLAQSLVNYKKLQDYQTFFVTGSDEHGEKIETIANKKNISPQIYVNEIVKSFKDLWIKLDINYDCFIRTTDKKHIQVVKDVFKTLQNKGIIYKGHYQGLYSIQDEEFFTKSQAVKNGQKYYSPISNHELVLVNEETYFLKFDNFKKWIKNIVLKPGFIIPNTIANELNKNFLDNLDDLSITRTSFKWGITLDDDPKHVIYVWFDALLNYISALDYDSGDNFKKFWVDSDTEIIHIIGKEISRFHCIYWPIILSNLNLRLPSNILSHGWITTPTGKMSKSKNNAIDPNAIIDNYGAETLKYFLMSQIKTGQDGIFSIELLISVYNTELVNIYGNLINRTLAMVAQNFDSLPKNDFSNDAYDLEMIDEILKSKKDFVYELDNLMISSGIRIAINLAKKLNGYIDKTLPWKLTHNLHRLSQVLHVLLNGIYSISTMLSIVIPKKTTEILKILDLAKYSLKDIDDFSKFNNKKLKKPNYLIFERY